MIQRTYRLTALSLLAALACLDLPGADSSAELAAATGRHTRVVWVQDAGPTACVYVEKPTVLLMGIDSADGKGEHPIIPAQNAYYRPVLTADGQRIVYTLGSAASGNIPHSVWVVPFAGGEPKQVLADGVAEDVWTDPEDDVTWVYAAVTEKRDGNPATVFRRFRLDQPSVSELVWDKTSIGHVQISGDGLAASGGAGGQGIFWLPNYNFASPTPGCWPSMSPDDSHRFWVFSGNHRSAGIFVPGTLGASTFDTWGVDFASAPGIPGNTEVYHPRWSNDIRFMTMTGPYSDFRWASDAKISNEVAAKVEVYIGRFSEDLRKIEQWVQVTHNQRGDYFPDVWIEPKAGPKPVVKRGPVAARPVEAKDAGLQYVFSDARGTNQATEADGKRIRICELKLTGNLRYGRAGVVECGGGAALTSHAQAIITACRSAGAVSVSCTITPASVQANDPAIIAAFDGGKEPDLALIQAGGRLFARIATSAGGTTVDLGAVVPERAQHLALTWSGGHLRAYRDGRRVLVGEEAPGDLKAWTATTIAFGAEGRGGRAWTGSLCDIAIRSRAIEPSEAATHAQVANTRAAARLPAARVVVDAVLVEHTPGADPKAIAPYVRCLSLSTYDVTTVVAGKLNEKRIAVYQWSVLDSAKVPVYDAMKVGATSRLVLEAFNDHPEQESERQTNTVAGAEDLPLYYDVAFATPNIAAAGDVRWSGTATAPWSKPGGPTALDRVLLDATTAKRSATISQPTVLAGLAIQQPSGAANSNSLTVTAPLRIAGGTAPLLAVTGAGAGLRVTSAPLTVASGSLGELALGGSTTLTGDGRVRYVHVHDGGTGYRTAPTVVFTGAGSGAVGQATLSVWAPRLTHLGSAYTSAPTVTFADPDTAGGRAATAVAALDGHGALSDIHLTDPGQGYLEAPTVTITGGGGSGARVQALCRVSGVAILNPGTGYTAMPAITCTGGSGTGVIATAHSQLTVLASTEPAGGCVLHNQGTLVQDGAMVLIDRAAATSDNNARASLRNSGTWTITHGGVQTVSSTLPAAAATEPWINSGALTLIDGSSLAFRELTNTGTLTVRDGGALSSIVSAEDEVILRNGAKGTIAILASTPDRPTVLGTINGSKNGSRVIFNGAADAPARLEVGDGKEGAALTLLGRHCRIENAPGSTLALRQGGLIALLTTDVDGQPTWRNAMVSNKGQFDYGGTLRLRGSGWGPIAIDNYGTVTITGASAAYERLEDCTNGVCTWSAFENHDTGIITGDGTLTYINSTNVDPRYDRPSLVMLLAGTVKPAGKVASKPATLTFVGVDMVLDHKAWVHAISDAPTGFLTNDMTTGPTFSIQLTGGSGSCDQIVLKPGNGTAKGGELALGAVAGSTLDVRLAPGIKPKGKYTVITAGKITGQFDRLRFQGADRVPFSVNYTPSTVDVVFP